ncbi:hypothetical protein [Arcobacter sp.]|uniref:hypothetical protein n=1 Tax=unclassified Arcobacter TaxID=2593671 RepID=UPI003B00E6E3
MKKINKLLVISSVLTVLLFTGCSNYENIGIQVKQTEHYCKKMADFIDSESCPYIISAKKDSIYLVQAWSNLSNYGFVHKGLNNSVAAAMQAAAQTTFLTKNKYFAIISPIGISNARGILMNTPEEFFEECTTSIGDVLILQSHTCDIIRKPKRSGVLTIQVFKEKPHDILIYDANDVIKYLKENGYYDDDIDIKNLIVH